MFRLLAVLCAGIYLAMLVGGADRGQQRFGLMPQARPVRNAVAAPVQPEVETRQAQAASARVTDVSFTPSQPVMVAPAVEVAPASAVMPDAPADAAMVGLRYINTASVNLRDGPGTDFAVLARLTRGEAVQVVEERDDGWTRIRIEGDGGEGFVASRLLAE